MLAASAYSCLVSWGWMEESWRGYSQPGIAPEAAGAIEWMARGTYLLRRAVEKPELPSPSGVKFLVDTLCKLIHR